MTRRTLRARVGADGVLSVSVPLGAAEANREVLVTVEEAPRSTVTMDRETWIKFIQATAGSIPDPTFERPPQGEYERRDELP